MEVENKRNRDAEDDDPDDLDVQADNGLRRQLISVICGSVTVMLCIFSWERRASNLYINLVRL